MYMKNLWFLPYLHSQFLPNWVAAVSLLSLIYRNYDLRVLLVVFWQTSVEGHPLPNTPTRTHAHGRRASACTLIITKSCDTIVGQSYNSERKIEI